MTNEILSAAYKALDDKFGKDIVILNISEISVLTDYFIIASGSNTSQIQAMADEVTKILSAFGINARHIEGYNSAEWILVDFGNIIVHIFAKENRAFYNLERIWADAKHVVLN